jgi:hypothetical protein
MPMLRKQGFNRKAPSSSSQLTPVMERYAQFLKNHVIKQNFKTENEIKNGFINKNTSR